MGKNDRLSRDQKRKAKLKKRAERSIKHESLAYHGNKYKTAEWAPIIHRTEIGIYESFVMSERTLTDDDVESSLGRLIGELRTGPRSLVSETDEPEVDDDVDDLTMWGIRRHWQILEDRGELPGRDDLIGILRTIIHSLEIWRSKNMHAQGFMQFLDGFMKKTGVSVERVSPGQSPQLGHWKPPLRGLPYEPISDDDEEDD